MSCVINVARDVENVGKLENPYDSGITGSLSLPTEAGSDLHVVGRRGVEHAGDA